MLSFDVRSVSLLTKIEDVESFLYSGRHAVNELLRLLCGLLIIENTTRGFKLAVLGVAIQSSYRVLTRWPDDDPDEGGDEACLVEEDVGELAHCEEETEDEAEDEGAVTSTSQRHQVAILDAAAMKVILCTFNSNCYAFYLLRFLGFAVAMPC